MAMLSMHVILAYIDPGTGGLMLQVLMAGLVGLAYRFRHAMARFFSIFRRDKTHDEPGADPTLKDK